MAHSPSLEKKRSGPCTTETPMKTNRADSPPITRRSSFAVRILQLIFARKPSPARDESRPKSWSGCTKPTQEAPSETLNRHASTSVIIPGGAKPPRSTRKYYAEGGDDESSASSWRHRQTYCLNCGGLFFISQSMLKCPIGQFCSLDCRTTFQYVHRIQDRAVQLLGVSDMASDSMVSSSNDEDYQVEAFDLDQF